MGTHQFPPTLEEVEDQGKFLPDSSHRLLYISGSSQLPSSEHLRKKDPPLIHHLYRPRLGYLVLLHP